MHENEQQCLKCLMSSFKDGKTVYDYPEKDGDGPDCDACLGPKTEDCDKNFVLTDRLNQKKEGR